jgi:hypothetical protein
MGIWTGGFTAIASGLSLLVLRGVIPSVASIFLANVIIMSGVLMTIIGTDRFLGRTDGHVRNYTF